MNTTFTINGATYTTNATGKYFYVTDDTRFQKRIPRKEYEAAYEQFVKEENERQNAAAENDEITDEQFCEMIAETEESNATEAGEEIAKEMLDEAMGELGYHPIDSEWNDIRYSTCDGQSKVMAWNTVEEGMEWVKEQELETEARMLENYCRHPEGTDLQKTAEFNQYGCVDCSKCNVQNCVHRDCMRRNPTIKGGLAECPRLKVKAEEPNHEMFTTNPVTGKTYYHGEDPDAKQPRAKKERKPRKSKNTAYTFSNGGVEFNLTAKQVDFIRHLPDTCFWQDGLDSAIWIDCLCDEIKGQFSNKPMTVGAMISTLCEKGLGARATGKVNGRKCTSFQLTAWGKAVAKDLGLE